MDPREYLGCENDNCLECEHYKTVDDGGRCEEVRRVMSERTDVDPGNYESEAK